MLVPLIIIILTIPKALFIDKGAFKRHACQSEEAGYPCLGVCKTKPINQLNQIKPNFKFWLGFFKIWFGLIWF